jgi:type II secretory pathway pseudopilin PulG
MRAIRDSVGETLVETLVTVAIMGIAAGALLDGMMIAVGTSQVHRSHEQAQVVLRNWAESVGTMTYLTCPSAVLGNFPAAPTPLPSGFSVSIPTVQYWNGTTNSFDSDRTRCQASGDGGLQKITLRVTVPASLQPGFNADLSVILRKPCESSC